MSEEKQQKALFDKGEAWEEHWRGMPEFKQENLEPYKTIYVHFETRADMEAFEKIVGQRIGVNTKSIWHPEATVNDFSKVRYIYDPSKDADDETDS